MYKAKCNNKIVGFCVVKKYGKRHHIMSIAILEEYRRKGIGMKLINKVKEDDNHKISLYVQSTNDIAIRFYKKNGFKNIKLLKDYYESLDDKNAYYFNFMK